LQSDGKIVVAGSSADGNGSVVARYHARSAAPLKNDPPYVAK
jgi:hypothetical protein